MKLFSSCVLLTVGLFSMSKSFAQDQTKGSRFHLQKYVNDFREEFSYHILSSSSSLLLFSSSKIEWVSPIVLSKNVEYQDNFLDILGFGIHNNELLKYWPKKGPVWDGLGKVGTAKNKGIVLVEAKAHKAESFSDMRAKAPDSVYLIEKTFLEAKQFYKVSIETDWTKKRYQLANRITFLYLLNEKLNIPTWLVYLNFEKDSTSVPTSKKEFIEHNQMELNELGLNPNSPLIDRIIFTYLEAKP